MLIHIEIDNYIKKKNLVTQLSKNITMFYCNYTLILLLCVWANSI